MTTIDDARRHLCDAIDEAAHDLAMADVTDVGDYGIYKARFDRLAAAYHVLILDDQEVASFAGGYPQFALQREARKWADT